MRKQIAAANWKMNLTWQQGQALLTELLAQPFELGGQRQMVLGIPFPYLQAAKAQTAGHGGVYVAAQNCYQQKSGAFTGEVSAEMLQSIGVDYVIIGHSERREYFNESNAVLAAKLDLCMANGMQPIFCCGEPLDIREKETQNDYVAVQLQESLFHLTAEQITGFVIAYEPIWAIGTGKTASSAQAQEMHAHIRQIMAAQYGQAVADSISILYGGSVKAANAADIFGQPDVDGGLVGGASLVAAEFTAIVQALK